MGSPRRKLVKDHHQLVLGEIDVPVNLMLSDQQGLYQFSESESSGSEEAAGLAKNWKDVSVGIGTALTVNLAISKLKRGITEKQRITSADKLGNGVVGYGRVRDHYPSQLVRRLANVGCGGDGNDGGGKDGAVEDPSVIYHEKDNELPTREARMAARIVHLSPVKGGKRLAALAAGRSVAAVEEDDHPLLVSPTGKFSVLQAALRDMREKRERVTVEQTLGIRASPRAVSRAGAPGSPRPAAPPTPNTPSVGRKAIMKPVDTPHPRLLYEDANDEEIELLVSEENEMAARADAARANRSRPTSRATSPSMSRSVSINGISNLVATRSAGALPETPRDTLQPDAAGDKARGDSIARQPSVTFLTPPRQGAGPAGPLALANRPMPLRAAESAPQLLTPDLTSALSAVVATRRIRRRVRRKKMPAERTNVVDPPRIMVLRPSVKPKGKQDYAKIKPRVPTRTGKVYKQRKKAEEPAPAPAAPPPRPLSAHVPRARIYRPPSPKKPAARPQSAGGAHAAKRVARPASAGESQGAKRKANRPQSAHVGRRSPYSPASPRSGVAARRHSTATASRFADGVFPPSPKAPGQRAAVAEREQATK